jgi:predicted secreted Zn-dependent protease
VIGLLPACRKQVAPAACPVSNEGKAGYEQSVDTHFYDIEGTTPKALSASIEERLPIPRVVKREIAALGYRVCPHWEYAWQGEGPCEVTRLRLVTNLLYVYPRWTPPAGTAPETLTWWANEERRTRVHEQGHAAIADEETRAMYEALSMIKSAPTCDELNRSLNARIDELAKKHEERQAEYDRVTEHGLKQ